MIKWRLLLIFFSISLFFILLPPFQTPDEPSHFEYAFWLSYGVYPKLPDKNQPLDKMFTKSLIDLYLVDQIHGSDRPIFNFHSISNSVKMSQTKSWLPSTTADSPINLQAYQPPLYYVLAAAAIKLTSGLGLNTIIQIYCVRLLSVGFYILTIYFVSRILSILISERSTAQNILLVFALNPLMIQIGVGINNDILLLLFSTIFIYLVLSTKEKSIPIKRTLLTATVTSAGILSKLSGLFMMPLFAINVLSKEGLARKSIKRLALYVLTIGAIVGAWLFVNQIRYGKLIVDNFALDLSKKTLALSFFGALISALFELRHAFMHYAGFVGWYQVYPFKEWFYPYTVLMIGLATSGAIDCLKKKDRQFSILLTAILLLLSFLIAMNFRNKLLGYDWDIQGRYLAPVFLPVILLVLRGAVVIFKTKLEMASRFWLYLAIFQYYLVLFFVLIPRFYV